MSTIRVNSIQHAGAANASIELSSNGRVAFSNNVTFASNVAFTSNNVTISDNAISPFTGFKNRIINGSFDIWQRGTSFSNMGNTTSYTSDRWSCFRDGFATNCAVSRVTGLSQNGLNRNALRMQRTAGDTSTAGLNVTQALESINSRDLAGRTVTVSFWARAGSNYSPTSSLLSVFVISGTGTDQALRGGFTGSNTFGTLNATLTTSFQRFTVTGTVPSNCNQIGLVFYWTPTGTAGANDFVDFMDVQLEEGSVATPFERRPFGMELALCQRYYQKSYALDTVPGTATATGGRRAITTTSAFRTTISETFPVTMRSSPTVTLYSTVTGSSTNIRVEDSAVDAAYILYMTSESGFTLVDLLTSSYQYQSILYQYTAAIEL